MTSVAANRHAYASRAPTFAWERTNGAYRSWDTKAMVSADLNGFLMQELGNKLDDNRVWARSSRLWSCCRWLHIEIVRCFPIIFCAFSWLSMHPCPLPL